jgi:hypothetical protein
MRELGKVAVELHAVLQDVVVSSASRTLNGAVGLQEEVRRRWVRNDVVDKQSWPEVSVGVYPKLLVLALVARLLVSGIEASVVTFADDHEGEIEGRSCGSFAFVRVFLTLAFALVSEKIRIVATLLDHVVVCVLL